VNDLDLEDLIKPISSDDYMSTLEGILSTLGVNPSRYRKGGVLRVLMRAQSMTFSGLVDLMIAIVRSGFLDLAEGGWLTLLARYVFGVERRGAQAASGEVTFTNEGGGTFAPGDYPAGSVRIYSSRTKKKYFNAEPLDLAPLSSVTIGVVAVELGLESNASAGDIDSLDTSLLRVSVRNADAVIGLEQESDAELRSACRAKLASISGLGPRGAYQWAVRQATRLDGSPTAINRVFVPEGSWNAIVDVYMAAASGAPIPGDMTAALASIEAVARPSGIKVNPSAATETPFDRLVTIWVQRTNGLNLDAIRSKSNQSIGTGLGTYPIGGIKKPSQAQGALYTDWVKGLCRVHPAVFDIDLSNESDLLLAANAVPTWTGSVEVRVV